MDWYEALPNCTMDNTPNEPLTRNHSKVNESRVVRRSLVIYPDHHSLVHTLTTNLVNNILFASKEFLAQHLGVEPTIDRLNLKKVVKVFLRLFNVVAKLDTV